MARIVILGAGESGAGAAVLAQKKGFDTFVSDMSLIKDKYKAMLNERGIQWEEGKHTEELILNADEVIKSPGIPNDAPIILKLKNQGTPIISEIEFAGRYTNAKMICITGSNGKTTTTSLIYAERHPAKQLGRCKKLGNENILTEGRHHLSGRNQPDASTAGSRKNASATQPYLEQLPPLAPAPQQTATSQSYRRRGTHAKPGAQPLSALGYQRPTAQTGARG